MNPRLVAVAVITAAVSFAAGVAVPKQPSVAMPLQSHIYRESDARKAAGDWGSIRVYTEEHTQTTGADGMLTALLEFLPGKQLQPPHQHPEEEFQYVIEGSGTWFLNGREIPLEKGDLMYAKPGDMHGISNTGSTPLRFFVIKWRSRQSAADAHPER